MGCPLGKIIQRASRNTSGRSSETRRSFAVIQKGVVAGPLVVLTSSQRSSPRLEDECEEVGLRVERIKADQDFQDERLSVYHLLSIIFEQSAAVKIVRNQNGQSWVKNFQPGT